MFSPYTISQVYRESDLDGTAFAPNVFHIKALHQNSDK